MIIAAWLLSALGILALYSSSQTLAFQQIIFCVIGTVLFFLVSRLNYGSLGSFVKLAYVIGLILLVIVFILGFETRGSVRWIPIGPFNLQPSELAKPILIVALAYFWSNRSVTWRNIAKSLAILAPYFILIFRQPDLGTALTVSSIWFAILIAANVSWRKLAIMATTGGILAPIGWLFLQSYQKQRIFAFLFPQQDPLGIGFHVIQSTIAVGSGELFGRGLGRGTQSRLQFLPEFQTDFIFAFIAEELGFIGSMVLLLFYGMLIGGLLRTMFNCRDRLGEMMIMGIIGMFAFQTTINIGMNIGIMPVTGITLPFVSYGGSSMLISFICLGLVASIARFGQKKRSDNRFELLA